MKTVQRVRAMAHDAAEVAPLLPSFGPRRWGRDLRREPPFEGAGRSHGGPDDHAEQPKWMGILMAPTKRVGHPEGLYATPPNTGVLCTRITSIVQYFWTCTRRTQPAGCDSHYWRLPFARPCVVVGGPSLVSQFHKPQDVAKVAYEQAATQA